MIPKKIHYCWYGGQNYPEIITKCIESWMEFLPDYELFLWNESNTDLSSPGLKNGLVQKKYAFVADFVRFKVLYEHGGIYLDTDMLILKSLNPLLNHSFVMGFEDYIHVNMAIIGSEKGHPLLKTILEIYDERYSKSQEFKVITSIITPIVEKFMGGLNPLEIREKDGVTLYPPEYFYPIPYTANVTWGKYNEYFTNKSYAAHLWYKSWYDEFSYFSIQEFTKGFKLLFRKLKENPFQPYSYYRFLVYSLIINFKKSLTKKKT